MPRVTINGTTLDVPDGTNVVQAAEMAGTEIPHYCYHPGLSVAGNCRMCLVDIKALSEKQPNPLPKLQIGCNTICQEGMVVESNNPKVEESRKGVLEFLLINHPIDCPICDQAGECKLQEYYMDYGRYRSRMPLDKKVHKRKVVPVGPNIMLDQERCILCTRCIRFLDEVTETNELCMTERGDHTELTLADGKSVDNDYSTNIVDICPVGALTSREFRFQARVWYLESTPSICAGCATGCNIDVHARQDEIFRLKPRFNDAVNGFWMCDEGRRTFQANKSELRLKGSYLRDAEAFQPEPPADVAARTAGALQKASRVALIASAHLTMEEGYLLAAIAERLDAPLPTLLPSISDEIQSDGKLISADRAPNRRGLYCLGFTDDAPENVDAVLTVRADPVHVDTEYWTERLEGADYLCFVADRENTTVPYADVIAGVTSHFEQDGSYVNAKGRLQASRAAVPVPENLVTAWKFLADVLHELGGPRYASVDEVFAGVARLLGVAATTLNDLGPTGVDVTPDADAAATLDSSLSSISE